MDLLNRNWCHQIIILISLLVLFIQNCSGTSLGFFNPSFSQFQTHRNLRNLPCVVLRTGAEGVCMFAIHCLKANGTHLGTCRDGYYFKSCCQLQDELSTIDHELNDNSIDQNTISHFQYQPTPLETTTSISTSTLKSSTGSIMTTTKSTTTQSLPSSSQTEITYIPVNTITIHKNSPTSLNKSNNTSENHKSSTISSIISTSNSQNSNSNHPSSSSSSSSSTSSGNSNNSIISSSSSSSSSISNINNNNRITTSRPNSIYTNLPSTNGHISSTSSLLSSTTNQFVINKNPSSTINHIINSSTSNINNDNIIETSSSNPSSIITTNKDFYITKLPVSMITTTENIKLQTFQSVQDTQTYTTASPPLLITTTHKITTPHRSSTTHKTTHRPTTTTTTTKPTISIVRTTTTPKATVQTTKRQRPTTTTSAIVTTTANAGTTTIIQRDPILTISSTKKPISHRPAKPNSTKRPTTTATTNISTSSSPAKKPIATTSVSNSTVTTRRPTTPNRNKPSRKPTTPVTSATPTAASPSHKNRTTITPPTISHSNITHISSPVQRPISTTMVNQKNITSTTTGETAAAAVVATTVAGTHRPITSTTEQPFVTVSFVQTTKIPRPKPRPTQQIVKVPPTSLDHLLESNTPTVTIGSLLTTNAMPLTSTLAPITKKPQISINQTTSKIPSTVAEIMKKPTTISPLTTISISGTTGDSENSSGMASTILLDELTTIKSEFVTWSSYVEKKNQTTMFTGTEPVTVSDWVLLPNITTNTSEQLSPSVTTSTLPVVTETTLNIKDKVTDASVQTSKVTEKPMSSSTTQDQNQTVGIPLTTESIVLLTEKPTIVDKPSVETTITDNILSTVETEMTKSPLSNITESSMSSSVSVTNSPPSMVSSISPPIVFPIDGITPPSTTDTSNNSTDNSIYEYIVGGTNISSTEISMLITTTIRPDVSTTMSSTTLSVTIPSLEGVDYRQVCGKRMYPEPRIVGGTKASFGRWPWQISLRQWRTSTYLHKCGAALLNENWAITAAHCVDNVPPSDLLLRLGEYDLAEEEEPYGYQERRVQIVASHPQFDPRTFEYDLALLRFYEPVDFQPNIIPVCVPETDENFIGRTAFVTGWGRLYEDGPLPSVLQEVSVPVINNTICESMYRSAGYVEHIPHIFICAGWRKGGYDSCEGDSGGPMVIQRDDKRFLLAGVISWGIGCAEPNQPGVYTRISEFRDWINQILQF